MSTISKLTKSFCYACWLLTFPVAYSQDFDVINDGHSFAVLHAPKGSTPSRFGFDKLPVLGQADGKVFLALDKVYDRRSNASILGGWRSVDFHEAHEIRKGTLQSSKKFVGQPFTKEFIQYPLDGDITVLSFSDDKDKGKNWEWVLTKEGGDYLKALDGKFAGWVVDFADPEDAVRKVKWTGGEVDEFKYTRWPARLVKEPGKMSMLHVFYPRKGGFDPERDVGK